MVEGDTFTTTWQTTNTNFPVNGSYTVSATWYDGSNHSPGHVIDSQSTTFTSIPAPWIIVAIAGLAMTIAALARKKRWWLSYYLVGSVAVVAALMSFFVLTGYDSYVMGVSPVHGLGGQCPGYAFPVHVTQCLPLPGSHRVEYLWDWPGMLIHNRDKCFYSFTIILSQLQLENEVKIRHHWCGGHLPGQHHPYTDHSTHSIGIW
jgi:hypothetical protein